MEAGGAPEAPVALADAAAPTESSSAPAAVVANEMLQRAGFAKLQAVPSCGGASFLLHKYVTVIGRESVVAGGGADVSIGGQPEKNKNVSRHHAEIAYNFAGRYFELKAVGKNGSWLRGEKITPTDPPRRLRSQDCIQVGDYAMHFLLPSRKRKAPPTA